MHDKGLLGRVQHPVYEAGVVDGSNFPYQTPIRSELEDGSTPEHTSQSGALPSGSLDFVLDK